MLRSMFFRGVPFAALLLAFSPAPASAQPGIVTDLAGGFSAEAVALPGGLSYSGTIGRAAHDSNLLVVGLVDGSFSTDIYLLDLGDNSLTDIYSFSGASNPLSAGGLTMIDAATLIVVDNFVAEDVLIGRDTNIDGKFQDTEFSPIGLPNITGGDPDAFGGPDPFTATKARLVRVAGAPSLPLGTLLVQSADGFDSGSSTPLGEIFAIADPAGTPGYVPAGGIFWPGTLEFDGGFDLTLGDTLVAGTALESASFAGQVQVARDLDLNGQIDAAGESAVLIGTASLPSGIFDLSANADGTIVMTSGGRVLIAQVAGPDPLTAGLASGPIVLVDTSSFFLGGGLLNDPSLPFEAFGEEATSAAYVFGDFSGSELYVVRPDATLGVENWRLY